MGPVQVLVVGYEQPAFTGEVVAEMARLSDAGLVRLVDLLLVTRAADGTFETVDVTEELSNLPQGNGALAAALLGHSDETGDDRTEAGSDDDIDALDGAVWSLADSVPAGTTAAVALIEHLWAAPLRAAVQRTGGVPLDEIWLAEADLQRLAAWSS